jgi:hypothetical protein
MAAYVTLIACAPRAESSLAPFNSAAVREFVSGIGASRSTASVRAQSNPGYGSQSGLDRFQAQPVTS